MAALGSNSCSGEDYMQVHSLVMEQRVVHASYQRSSAPALSEESEFASLGSDESFDWMRLYKGNSCERLGRLLLATPVAGME